MKFEDAKAKAAMIDFLQGKLKWARLNQLHTRPMDVRKRAIADEEEITRELQEVEASEPN